MAQFTGDVSAFGMGGQSPSGHHQHILSHVLKGRCPEEFSNMPLYFVPGMGLAVFFRDGNPQASSRRRVLEGRPKIDHKVIAVCKIPTGAQVLEIGPRAEPGTFGVACIHP